MTEPKKPAMKKKPATPKPKTPAKRKAASKKPVIVGMLWCLVAGVIGAVGGIFFAGGVRINPDPKPSDVLNDAYDADRVTQIAILKELASQPFDGSTDEGREAAGKWFNAQRFRNRANDFEPYTDAVSEAIGANAENELAAKLEAVK